MRENGFFKNRKMWYVTDSCCHVTGGVKNLVVQYIRNARAYQSIDYSGLRP